MNIMRIKHIIAASVMLLSAGIFFSCDQYPIFFAISLEVKPTDPRIKGNPTTVVELGGKLYVATRGNSPVYVYSPGWSTIPAPAAPIQDIASDGTRLYALCGDPMTGTTVFRCDPSAGDWEAVAGGGIQAIAGADGYVFASTRSELLYYADGMSGFTSVLSGLSEANIVTGAVYTGGVHYVSVMYRGIYTFNGSALSGPIAGTDGTRVKGLIDVGGTVVGVTTTGVLLYGNSASFAGIGYGFSFTGALALWKTSPSAAAPSLLLIGTEVPNFPTNNGYMELRINDDGTLNTASMGLMIPGGGSPTTVSNMDQYTSTIGLHSVTGMHQAPDGTLFAATRQNGLWSYRQRNEGHVWNAEE